MIRIRPSSVYGGYGLVVVITEALCKVALVSNFGTSNQASIDPQQYPTREYCHSLIIVNQKNFFSNLIQNMIYKLIVQTFVPKTSKFV